MIKYIELTAPESAEFRQCKIIEILCQEGERVTLGQALFKVKSGDQERELPATSAGRVTEIIVQADQNISISTPLVLLETVVEQATSELSQKAQTHKEQVGTTENPKNNRNKTSKNRTTTNKATKKKVTKKRAAKQNKKKNKKNSGSVNSKATPKHHLQQSLDLMLESHSKVNPVEHTQPGSKNIMASEVHSKQLIPDIGTDSAKVIEILVKPGERIDKEQTLLTLESDKASMDVPSTEAGVVMTISVSLDDEVSTGDLILTLQSENHETSPAVDTTTSTDDTETAQSKAHTTVARPQSEATQVVTVPDIGGGTAKVIELLASVGQTISAEDALLTLESDKASMDVPSPYGGEIIDIKVSVDQEVSMGDELATIAAMTISNDTENTHSAAPAPSDAHPLVNETKETPSDDNQKKAEIGQNERPTTNTQTKAHASPSIRRFARELGVNLADVVGSGRKGRVLREDVKAFVKQALQTPRELKDGTTTGIAQIPAQDFEQFGEIERRPLNKIKRLTASNLHRAWLNVPHVTHHDEANITELESFRKKINDGFSQRDTATKISPLAFIVKAIVRCLKEYPQFNASLDVGGENLIYKKYFNVGIAVDTPNGLVVPVVKQADTLSVSEIAQNMSDLASKARNKKLSIGDMSGACITISSLGGIGGTSFTPIVNAPEVAILGVSRSKVKPVWNGSEFEPGLMLPLSLSYDHRVIDGAEAARFTRHLAQVLEDVRLLTI